MHYHRPYGHEKQPVERRHAPTPYVHPVRSDRLRGKARGANFVVAMLVGVGGLSRSFFTKPRTARRACELYEAVRAVAEKHPDLVDVVRREVARRWLRGPK